ncbi:MAG: FeoB-associated Cys-rich membrane protein [Lachnospiraceae bacterium]|nr:FeoB-associated Cys-rich membrane protein [Lachnospiraceae bacterium]
MKDIILIGILAFILGAAIIYIIRAKRRGVKCIGCPAGAECSGKCSGKCAGCSSYEDQSIQ